MSFVFLKLEFESLFLGQKIYICWYMNWKVLSQTLKTPIGIPNWNSIGRKYRISGKQAWYGQDYLFRESGGKRKKELLKRIGRK